MKCLCCGKPFTKALTPQEESSGWHDRCVKAFFGTKHLPQTDVSEATLQLLAPDYINGLTLLGGEPFEPENQKALLPFLRRVRASYPKKNIWGFSGFTYEELTTPGTHCHCEATEEMLSLLDVLVDGRFVEELKDISLRFRGSRNQRLIDLNASRRAGHLCFLPDRQET